MMKRNWKCPDTVVVIVLCLFITLSLIAVVLFLFGYIVDKDSAEITYYDKISEKGIHFGPKYKAVTKKGIFYITKEQYESASKIEGYETKFLWYTPLDVLFDGGKLIALIALSLTMSYLCIHYFYQKFIKKDSHIKQNKWLQKVINIGLVLYVVSSGIFLSIALFNTAQKVIPLGHMKSYAKVNDRVVEKGRGRFVTDTHYIIVQHNDAQSILHTTKLKVPFYLYNKYKNHTSIPIHYPKSNPANVFVQLQSLKDHFFLLSIHDIIYLWFFIYSYQKIYVLFKRRRKVASFIF